VKLARLLFGAIAIAFLAIAFRDALHRSKGLSLPEWPNLVAAVTLQLAAVIFSSLGWASLFEGRSRWLLARGYLASQLAKYIPGAIWQPIGQVKLAADAGVRVRPAAVTFLLHAGIQVIAGGMLGVLVVFSDEPSTSIRLLALLGLLPALMLQPRWLVSLFRALERWTRRRIGSELVLGQAVLRSLGWSVATLAAAGLGFTVLLTSVAPPEVRISPTVAVPAFVLAWTAGFLAIPVPAGLGIREGVLIAVLGPTVTAAPVIAASVFQRLVAMGVELALFAATRRRGPALHGLTDDRLPSRLGTYYRSNLLRCLGQDKGEGRILDIGGFDGYWAASVDGGIAYSLDIDTHARFDGVRYIRGNGQALPFSDGTFDVVFALDVIEHVPDEGRVIAEAVRVLRSGGRLVLTTPSEDIRIFPGFLQPWADRRWGHDRLPGFRADALQAKLEASGATNVTVSPLATKAFRAGYLPLSVAWRISGRVGQFLVEKVAEWDARHLRGPRGYLLVEATGRAPAVTGHPGRSREGHPNL